MNNASSPIPSQYASILGYLGLLPFIIPNILLVYDEGHAALWLNILITYAAVILSFVGALHWAFAMTLPELSLQQRRWGFAWSIIPAMVAWVSLVVAGFDGLLIMAAFFVANFMQDVFVSKNASLPNWYVRLRFHLSLVATSCLLIAASLTMVV